MFWGEISPANMWILAVFWSNGIKKKRNMESGLARQKEEFEPAMLRGSWVLFKKQQLPSRNMDKFWQVEVSRLSSLSPKESDTTNEEPPAKIHAIHISRSN